MKNFLIPTRLISDTFSAVKTAVNHSKNSSAKIILLFVSEEIDSFSAAQYLREQNSQITNKELEVLENCQNYIEHFPNCKFEFKRQFGISNPLLKNFIQYNAIDLILLTKSIVSSKKNVLIHLVNCIENQKTPILHLSNETTTELNKAIYLENNLSRLNIEDIQQFMQEQFPSQTISQVLKKEHETAEHIHFLLKDVLSKNDIDFVIETRTSERSKVKRKKQTNLNNHFDIPVLSLYEGII